MISLITSKYCDNCPEFDARSNILYGDDIAVATHIECSNRDKCERIYRYLKKELDGQAEVEKLYSSAIKAIQRYNEN